MIATHETLILEAGDATAQTLSPGGVLRALAVGAGLRAEDIGALMPAGRGAIAVEVTTTRAMRLATPLTLPARVDGQSLLLTLRREDDVPLDSLTEVLVRWEDGGPPPAPGALATALAVALRGNAGGESIGAAFFGGDWGRITLPASLATSPRFPETLEVEGRPFALTPAGKKKP